MARLSSAIGLFVVMVTLASAQTSQSSTAVHDLVLQLTSHHLDAVAAVDPQTPGRFIAAMYIPPSQLLVVGARHPAVDAEIRRIHDRQYQDVYLDLQAGPAGQDKLFIHDIGADGLNSSDNAVLDNAYRDGVRMMLVKGGRPTELFTMTDAEYIRMLRVLTDALSHQDATLAQTR